MISKEDKIGCAVDGFSAEDEIVAAYRKVTWRVLPLLFLCYVFNYIDRTNIGMAQIHFKADLGFSDTVYGLGAGVFFIGFLLFEVPSNLMLAKIGARKTLLRIMTLWGLISALTMFVTTPAQFYGARFLLGAAEAGFFPGIILYLSYWYRSTHRARITSMFFIAIPLSGILGSPLSGWIMQNFAGRYDWKGWQWLFLLEGGPSIVLGVLAYLLLADKPSSAKWLSERERRILVDALAAEERPKAGRAHLSLLKVLSDRRIYIAGSVSFASYILASTISFFSPEVIYRSGITKVVNVGVLSAIPPLVGMVIMIFVSRHSDITLERRWHAAVALMCAAASLALLPMFSANPMVSIILLAVAAAGHYSGLSVFWTIPPTYLSTSSAPGGIAVVSSIGALGGAVAPALLGWVKTQTGSLALGLELAAGMVLLGSLVLLLGIPATISIKSPEDPGGVLGGVLKPAKQSPSEK
jgi:ACS family phthalate transporter-like MFS transporter